MSCEETFGPVAGINRFATDAEAVAIANDTPYGLSAYFYTRDLGRTWRVAEGLEYGIVGINTGFISTEVAPFGGMKESGIGREGSSYGVDDWVELKYLADGRDRGADLMVDRRAARLPRPHGQAARARAALRGGGDRDPAGGARRLRRRLHDRDRGALDVHEHVALRQLRRARGAAGGAAGARRLEGVPGQDPAADPHPAEPDPDADRRSRRSARRARWASSTARSRSSPAPRRASATRSRTGLAAEGARIVVADLHGAEAAAEAFPDGVGLTADVADEAAVQALVDEVVERCGTIDVLVNNAGLYASLAMRPFTEIPLAEWRQVMDVNVASMFLMCRAVVPVMQRNGRRPRSSTSRPERRSAACRSCSTT